MFFRMSTLYNCNATEPKCRTKIFMNIFMGWGLPLGMWMWQICKILDLHQDSSSLGKYSYPLLYFPHIMWIHIENPEVQHPHCTKI